MSIRWTRTSVRSFVWNLTRSLFNFTSLFKFPMAKVVAVKPTPAEPRATPASAPKTAAPTIAALNFFLKRNTRIGSTSSPYFDRVSASVPHRAMSVGRTQRSGEPLPCSSDPRDLLETEATAGIEPAMKGLQTSALPLGYLADEGGSGASFLSDDRTRR